jgi:conjugal transfer mating pair stabilization protein TraG
MIKVHNEESKGGDKLVTCLEASKPEGTYSLPKKLEVEIKKSYQFFGVNLFGKSTTTSY